MKKVLNFGSLNIDYVYKLDHIVACGETISSKCMNVYPGGKGLNQSVALGKAGLNVYHAGAIGPEGRFLAEFLEQSGVNTKYIKILTDEKSGHAIIQNDRDGDNCILLYGGANQEITLEQIEEVLRDFGEGDYLILQNEINHLKELVDQAFEKQMTIVLNPSPMNDKITELDLDKIDYFILNEIEGCQILNCEEKEAKCLVDRLRQRLPQSKIVLTLGSAGSMYIEKDKLVSQEIYKVPTVDTTAAGDTFTGYFLAGVIHGETIEQSLDDASKAAAITVSRNGAGVAIPTIEEVKAWKFDTGRR